MVGPGWILSCRLLWRKAREGGISRDDRSKTQGEAKADMSNFSSVVQAEVLVDFTCFHITYSQPLLLYKVTIFPVCVS